MGFFDQMKQLNELKSKMEEVKSKLDTLEVVEEDASFKITTTGNRKVKSIEVKDPIAKMELLTAAINRALEKTDSIVQSEMMGAMPSIPGL
jgi:DNA-binding protein YbaB